MKVNGATMLGAFFVGCLGVGLGIGWGLLLVWFVGLLGLLGLLGRVG